MFEVPNSNQFGSENEYMDRKRVPLSMTYSPSSRVTLTLPTTMSPSTITGAGGPSCRAPVVPAFQSRPHLIDRDPTLDTPVATFATNITERGAIELGNSTPASPYFDGYDAESQNPASGGLGSQQSPARKGANATRMAVLQHTIAMDKVTSPSWNSSRGNIAKKEEMESPSHASPIEEDFYARYRSKKTATMLSSRLIHDPRFNHQPFEAPHPMTTAGKGRRFLADLYSTTAMAENAAAASSALSTMFAALHRPTAPSRASKPLTLRVNNKGESLGSPSRVVNPIDLVSESEAILHAHTSPLPSGHFIEGHRQTALVVATNQSRPSASDAHTNHRLLPLILEYLTPDELSCIAVFVCKAWYKAIISSIRLQVRRKLFEPAFLYEEQAGLQRDHGFGNDGRGILFYLGNKFRGDPPLSIRQLSVSGRRPLYLSSRKQQQFPNRQQLAESVTSRAKLPSKENDSVIQSPRRYHFQTATLYQNPAEGIAPSVVVMCSRLLKPLPPARSLRDHLTSHLANPSGGSFTPHLISSPRSKLFDSKQNSPAKSPIASTLSRKAELAQRGKLTNFTSFGPSYCMTENMPYSWVGVDFGHFRVAPTAYTLGTISMEAQLLERASGLGISPSAEPLSASLTTATVAHLSTFQGHASSQRSPGNQTGHTSTLGLLSARSRPSVSLANTISEEYLQAMNPNGGAPLSAQKNAIPSIAPLSPAPGTQSREVSDKQINQTSSNTTESRPVHSALQQPPFPIAWELQGCKAKQCQGDVYDPSDWADQCRWHVLDKRDYRAVSRAAASASSAASVNPEGNAELPTSAAFASNDAYPFSNPHCLSATFAISPEVAARWGYFKRFRIVQTDRNSTWGHELAVSGFEVYGSLVLDRRS